MKRRGQGRKRGSKKSAGRGRERKRRSRKSKKQEGDCENSWKYFADTGLCYRYYEDRKSWDEARSACEASAPASATGDLASIPDRKTNTFVSNLAPSTAWIGGIKHAVGGDKKWQWSDDSKWNFESWQFWQPDNGKPWSPDGEHYVGTNFFGRGKWNDWDKKGHTNWFAPVKGFICQYKRGSGCVTVSGDDTGSSCVFPFTIGGVTYNECAPWPLGGPNDGKFWCSTKVTRHS